MEIRQLGPDAFFASLTSGCDYLEVNRKILDNLNVYPVPDGDTGVNMVLTFKPAIEELHKIKRVTFADISKVMNVMLAGNSRGNSGFILAQFFRGFWEAADGCGCDFIDSYVLERGFAHGLFTAVSSLLRPVPGTMITIIASMADAIKRLEKKNIVYTFESAVEAGLEALFKTPEQLPLLAEAGVVDAGALGFIFIIKGMLCGILKNKVEAEHENDYRFTPDASAFAGDSGRAGQTEFRYCVELDIETGNEPAAPAPPTNEFKDFLRQSGGSIALITADGRIRIHIHTNTPEKIIEKSGALGKVTHSKIDDMAEQIATTGKTAERNRSAAGGEDSVSVLSIIPGPGFGKLFEELGAAACYEYSRTLPSMDDLLKFVEQMQCDNIIVLPNNPNIIPTIRLMKEQTRKRVYTLDTNSVVDGITAMYGYVESASVKENVNGMNDCIGLADTLKVFKSSRDTVFGQVRIENGNYFVVRDSEVLSSSAALEEAVATAVKNIDISGKSNISLFYGDNFETSVLDRIKERLSTLVPALQFEHYYGGQEQGIIIAVE